VVAVSLVLLSGFEKMGAFVQLDNRKHCRELGRIADSSRHSALDFLR
jgi:hypothetical protein